MAKTFGPVTNQYKLLPKEYLTTFRNSFNFKNEKKIVKN